MPSHKKKLIFLIIFNLAISLIVANKITNVLFNNILLEIPTYLIIASISFTILSYISHKIWAPIISVKNLKLTRILKKKL